MPLPSSLVFNELSGDETKHVLEERFHALLDQVPFLQRHLTLPRVRMTLQVKLELYADQPNPEIHRIDDKVDVVSDSLTASEEPTSVEELEDQVSAAPGPGGHPPDQVREEHGITPPAPSRGDRSIGAHIVTSDRVEDRVVELVPGVSIDRTGRTSQGYATVINQDFGPAGLRSGGQRPVLNFKSGGK